MIKTRLLRLRNFITQSLIFLRILDPHDGLVSLTNVALIIMLIKLCSIQNTNMVDLGSFFLALTGYQYKKFLNKDNILKAQTILNQVANKIEQINPDDNQQP